MHILYAIPAPCAHLTSFYLTHVQILGPKLPIHLVLSLNLLYPHQAQQKKTTCQDHDKNTNNKKDQDPLPQFTSPL